MIRCNRCRGQTIGTTMSIFNTDTICLICKAIEKTHPDYDAAARRENDAVRGGDYNFPGVGLPAGYTEWASARRAELEAA